MRERSRNALAITRRDIRTFAGRGKAAEDKAKNINRREFFQINRREPRLYRPLIPR